ALHSYGPGRRIGRLLFTNAPIVLEICKASLWLSPQRMTKRYTKRLLPKQERRGGFSTWWTVQRYVRSSCPRAVSQGTSLSLSQRAGRVRLWPRRSGRLWNSISVQNMTWRYDSSLGYVSK